MSTAAIEAPRLRIVWPNEAEELDLDRLQGLWTEEQYLQLSGQTNKLFEFTDGNVELLPMPTNSHQVIVALLYELLLLFVRPRQGKVLFAPLRLRIRQRKFREPDLLLLLDERDPRKQEAYWLGADLVVEVVSPDDPERDTKLKRLDYAEAGIPEYWIVNPLDETFTVLTLVEGSYREHGIFRRGEQAVSTMLSGFTVSVDAIFDAR